MSDYKRILYVDDDKDSCEMISLMLRLADNSCAVKTTVTAQDALDLIEEQSFDLFILDYRLPDMTGVELCSKIRQIDKTTPIMFFSAMSRDIDRKSAMVAGANKYLVKPNDFDSFAEVVGGLLNLNSYSDCKSSIGFCGNSPIH